MQRASAGLAVVLMALTTPFPGFAQSMEDLFDELEDAPPAPKPSGIGLRWQRTKSGDGLVVVALTRELFTAVDHLYVGSTVVAIGGKPVSSLPAGAEDALLTRTQGTLVLRVRDGEREREVRAIPTVFDAAALDKDARTQRTASLTQRSSWPLRWRRSAGDVLEVLAVDAAAARTEPAFREGAQVVAINGKRVASISPGRELQALESLGPMAWLKLRVGTSERTVTVMAIGVDGAALDARAAARRCALGDCPDVGGPPVAGPAPVAGPGRLEVPGRYTYEGGLAGGVPHGQGTVRFASKDECSGTFVQGELPRGRCVAVNGVKYEGELRNLRPAGLGEMTFADGTRFKGRFVDGKSKGEGTLVLRSGLSVRGIWSDTIPEGPITATWPDGWTYQGPWSKGDAKQRPSGSYSDARGKKQGEAPFFEEHPKARVEAAPAEVVRRAGVDLAATLRARGYTRTVLERRISERPRLAIHLGTPDLPPGVTEVAILVLGDPREVADVGIYVPGTLQVVWGANHGVFIETTADAIRGRQLSGKVSARNGVKEVSLSVTVLGR